MARDTPVTDDELEAARAAMHEQRDEIRSDLEAAGVDVSAWTTPTEAEPDADRDAADTD